MKTGEGVRFTTAVVENAATFRPKNDSQQALRMLLSQVFIPDLLIPITKFLGDDDVAIRFVCKPAHRSLQSEISRVAIPVLQGKGKFGEELVNHDAISKRIPYVTSVSKAEWARDYLEMPMNENTFLAVVTSGVLDVVKWMQRSAKIKGSWNMKMCRHAAASGHLHVLQWARSQDPPCPWDSSVCSHAAQNGHLHVLQWLRAQDPPCPWNSGVCCHAAENGHLDMLQWARAQDPPCPWDAHVSRIAAQNGHLDMLQWARAQNPPCEWDIRQCLRWAKAGYHAETIAWLRNQAPRRYLNENRRTREMEIYDPDGDI